MKFDYAQMGRDFDAGMTRAAIAQKHGCSWGQANQAVARRAASKHAPDSEISAILTEVFRKHMGFCPLYDERPASGEAAA